MVWYSHLLKNFPQFIMVHTVKGFGIVNKAEIDVFLELSCFFHDPADVGNLISGSSAFSKTSLNITHTSWRLRTIKVFIKEAVSLTSSREALKDSESIVSKGCESGAARVTSQELTFLLCKLINSALGVF